MSQARIFCKYDYKLLILGLPATRIINLPGGGGQMESKYFNGAKDFDRFWPINWSNINILE